jgi:hypothetical protein
MVALMWFGSDSLDLTLVALFGLDLIYIFGFYKDVILVCDILYLWIS